MSKIVVDQIQKNGGTTFTLPSTDGGANAPLVTNGSGTLAYSPLKLPAADGTANKPITTDGSGQLQFNPAALPATIGTAGQTLSVNSGADALEYVAASSGVAYKKTFDFNVNPASVLDIEWSDISSEISYANIAGVRLNIYEIATNGGSYLYIYGLNSSGSPITSGYLGGQSDGQWGGAQEYNSNQGWMKFPNYNQQFTQTGYSYGFGMTGSFNFVPWREGSGNNYNKSGGCSYHMRWQHSSNTYNYNEQGAWGCYSNDTTPDPWEGGLRLYATNGTFNHGRVVVEVQMKD
jgi:hypothetical protein